MTRATDRLVVLTSVDELAERALLAQPGQTDWA